MLNARWNFAGRLFVTVIGAIACSINAAQAAPIFNVKAFGAVGNGTTDDTAAIARAITAANARPGSSVFFPRGNYLYSSQLNPSSITVFGQNATLTSANSSAVLVFSGFNDALRNMTFATQISGGAAVEFSDVSRLSVTSNTFLSGFGTDVVIGASDNGLISNNVLNLKQHAIGVVVGVGDRIAVQSNRLLATDSNNSAATGVEVGDGSNITVSANAFQFIDIPLVFGSVDTLNCAKNIVNGFLAAGEFSDCTNVNVTSNVWTAGAKTTDGLLMGHLNNCLISSNHISGAPIGVEVSGSTNLQISDNVVQNSILAGVSVGPGITTRITHNVISNCGIGIFTGGLNDSIINLNTINQCQKQGIANSSATGSESITQNTLSNCGLSSSAFNPAAVIFVSSPSATSIPISGNTYTGNTKNLSYFIWCVQTQPPAQVSGNRTNTGLPNRIGS